MKENIQRLISEALKNLKFEIVTFSVEHPSDPTHGDFATNVAMVLAKQAKSNPREVALKIKSEIENSKSNFIEKIEIAGPGFINFFIQNSLYLDEVARILKQGEAYGTGRSEKGTKVLIEYTDPNPFKEFHIGHLMSNAIGESLSRLIESQGAKVKRACYQGDVGLHVAKTLWACLRKKDEFPSPKASLQERISFLGAAYVEGSRVYEDEPLAKKEIEEINKKVFEKSDKELNRMYAYGRKWSLEQFGNIYKKLGTKFDYFFFESEIADSGMRIVGEFLKTGVFEESYGATVFHAEKYNPKLHTRVFINSQGLPTYETKELGLNKLKYKKVKPDRSIIVTANEQSEYFKVVLQAIEIIMPEVRSITEHVSHGMLRFAEGKMSSRKGNVITGESLIRDVEAMVLQKIKDRGFDEKEAKTVSEMVAVSAIKYSVLRQAIGGDIIYDFEKSISFEGDSGPYLLYTAVRAKSVLEKAKKEGVRGRVTKQDSVTPLHKVLSKYPEMVSRAAREKAPHLVASYLIEVASMFNGWYANNAIVVIGAEESPSRVALTSAVRIVLINGLTLLGMKIPERM